MNSAIPSKIIHITHDMAEFAGGIPAVVRQLSERLDHSNANISCKLIHSTGNPGFLPFFESIITHPPYKWCKHWEFGPGIYSSIKEAARTSDANYNAIFHIHGVWSAPQFLGAISAHKANIPYIISSHGMLEPWLWNQQGNLKYIKKKVYWKTFANPSFKNASIIHAITPLERDNLRKLFPTQRIEVIPNAINVKNSKPTNNYRSKKLLFLGRLEPKKGIHLLLNAFSTAKISKEWTLDIVGPSWSDEYLRQLNQFVSNNGLSNRVNFVGPAFGDTKLKFLKEAWVMLVPSYSEVVGLVNLEAAANYLPSITTHETGLFNWLDGGGLLTHPDPNSIAAAIEQACSWTESERNDRGLSSFNLVKQYYSWQNVLPKWTELYTRLASHE